MFERYTDEARRVIFAAHQEATRLASNAIDTQHLLAGVLREVGRPAARALRNLDVPVQKILDDIAARVPRREAPPESVDLPLTRGSRDALSYAAEEADRMKSRSVGPEHILLGLLREANGEASWILVDNGVMLETLREEIGRLRRVHGEARGGAKE